MNKDNTEIIFGPPGTGKTTRLIALAESYFEQGYQPEDICFVTFTRKGAAEARHRATEKFKFTDIQLRWWKTLHALAFLQLGLSRSQVMGPNDYFTLCGQLGLTITNKGMSEDGNISGLSKGDRLFFMENMARAKMMSLKDYWEASYMEDIYWYELELLSKTMLEYKAANGKQDFTDIIYSFNHSPMVPNIKILIVDEAQDLTPLQWQMVENLSKDVERVFVAGDDDQAIFRWAGADVNRFIQLPGQRHILPQSYRVPMDVQRIAEKIANRITNRIDKHWKPTNEKGEVIYVNNLEHIDMSVGSWLLLARNLYLLEKYNIYCLQMGYVFDSHIGSPIRGASLAAIVVWEELRKSKQVKAVDCKKVFDMMSSKLKIKHGAKTKLDKVNDDVLLTLEILKQDYGLLTDAIWHEALDKIDVYEREYFISALRRGEKLLKEPRIKINTIHSVKGGEADHIVVLTDMAQRTWNEFLENEDDEHRVWYVAVTRARKSLHIVTPQTDRAYDI